MVFDLIWKASSFKTAVPQGGGGRLPLVRPGYCTATVHMSFRFVLANVSIWFGSIFHGINAFLGSVLDVSPGRPTDIV